MAIHFNDSDLKNKPLVSFINDNRLHDFAIKAEQLLSQLPQLKVWEVQYKRQGMANTTWYVGLSSKKEPFLLNFTIIPSDLNIEFRFSQYLPIGVFDELQWQNTSWRYAKLKKHGQDKIKQMIDLYLENIRGDFESGLLKQGGKSFAEKIIYTALKDIFPGLRIENNIRPDDLRSQHNKPLELDLYIPDKRIAFEIQGPQHFKMLYGCNKNLQKNDNHKKNWCRENGIKLVWMNWEGINGFMKGQNPNHRLKIHITELLRKFLEAQGSFLWWKDSQNQSLE